MNNKNKIYAFVSISVVVLTAASFFAAVNFLLKINNLVFNVDKKIIKEQTTVLNKEGFEKIKNKLNPGKNSMDIEEKFLNIDAAEAGNADNSGSSNSGSGADKINNAGGLSE